MAYFDHLQHFGTDEAADGANGTHRVGDDGIFVGTPRDIGNGESMYLVIQVKENFAGGSSNLQLVSSDTRPVPTNGTAKVHWQSGVIAAAQLTAGRRWVVELPTDGTDYGSHLAILNTVSDGTVTAGTIDAFLSFDKMGWRAYAEAVS